MTTNHDRPKVYRVQGLPDYPGFDRLAAARLVASAISDPTVTADDIQICSLATTVQPHKRWNRKVATVMFRNTPSALGSNDVTNDSVVSEWRFPVLGEIEPLVLDSHFLGLTVLNDISLAEHKFDCIALSGLASHPFGSWQPKGDDKSYMWIRDTLPTTIDGVRFILYGYDTTLMNSHSFQTIVDLANTLYLTLQTHGWASPSAKPLIFLAHSLGGVLVKQLIVMLAGANDIARFMLRMIKGAIFFGTPSRSMALGQLLTMVGDQPNRELVEQLSRASGFLPNLETQFSGISQLQRMRLVWAYETKTSPTVQKISGSYKRSGPRIIMVDRQSATGSHQLNPSFTIQIDENHSDMVKFSRGDHRIPIIISKIQEICISGKATDELDTTVTTMSAVSDPHYVSDTSYNGPYFLEYTRNSELADWDYDLITSLLEAPERDQRHEQIDQNFNHTFSWAFENPEISLSQWLRKGEGIFWINGKPGSGKSTFMKFLLNDNRTRELLYQWKSKPGRVTASFFFHHRGTHLQKSFNGLLKSLLSQLLGGDPRLHEIVGVMQSKEAAELYERIHSDIHSFLQLCNITAISTTHQKRIFDLLTENPSLRLHRILEEEAPDMIPNDRFLIKQTLLRDFARLRKSACVGDDVLLEEDTSVEEEIQENTGLREKEKEILYRKLLLKFPTHGAPISIILKKWFESMDISIRIRKILEEAQLQVLQPNTEQHLTELLERQNVRLINNQLMWWTQVNLEEGLRQIMNQNTFDLEVCLLFDALDEYDGSPEFISGFLKDLVEVRPKSRTRTKILFSSRPWTIFRDHFDTCLGISIHEFTKDDIEQYCAGSLPTCDRAKSFIRPFVREITNRARGVFLWVKLVMSDLNALVTTLDKSDAELRQILRKCLDDIPDELEEYYSTIIHRLPTSTRGESYILLESLSKSSREIYLGEVPSLLACGMCDSLHEAQNSIRIKSAPGYKDPGGHVRTITGGMVDLVPVSRNSSRIVKFSREQVLKQDLEEPENGIFKLELMHQAVKEWVAFPTFKYTILGTRADTIWQTGHSFLVKYCVHLIAIGHKNVSRSETLEYAAKAEMTTGVSQYTYLSQLPRDILARVVNDGKESFDPGVTRPKLAMHPAKEEALEQNLEMKRREAHTRGPLDFVVPGLEFAALSGLSLYLEDLLQHEKLVFQRSVGPLLSISLIEARRRLAAQQLDMAQGNLASVELMLNNGFPILSDHAAIPLIFEGIWSSRDQKTAGMYMDLVMAAVRNGLPVGDRYDISLDPCSPTSLLHLSPPILAKYLLEKGADPNGVNRVGKTPLDYILESESVFQNCVFGLDWLYDATQLLVQNGARQRRGTGRRLRLRGRNFLQNLSGNGYDVRSLRSLENQFFFGFNTTGTSPLHPETGGEATDVPESGTSTGGPKVRSRLARILRRSGVSSPR